MDKFEVGVHNKLDMHYLLFGGDPGTAGNDLRHALDGDGPRQALDGKDGLRPALEGGGPRQILDGGDGLPPMFRSMLSTSFGGKLLLLGMRRLQEGI